MVSLGLTWHHSANLASLGLTWKHLDSFEITWTHMDSLGLTWTHLDVLGLTRTHMVSFGGVCENYCHLCRSQGRTSPVWNISRESGESTESANPRTSSESYILCSGVMVQQHLLGKWGPKIVWARPVGQAHGPGPWAQPMGPGP